MTEVARMTIEIDGEASAEGVLVVSGEIGSRAQLRRAIEQLIKAADTLWPRVTRRGVVAYGGDPAPGRSALDGQKR